MSLRSVIAHSNAELTVAEQRIAGLMLAAPADCLLLSALQLARRSSVHESTVIRFAQKLGYAGYPALRLDLAAEARQMSERGTQRWLRRADTYELTAVLQDQLRTLARLPDYLSQQSVDAAAAALLKARRIFIYGQDFARAAVELMDRKLRLMGFDVVAMQHSVSEAAEHLATAQRDDVLLAYLFELQRREASRLLTRVAAQEITTILITDHTSISLRPAPTYLLAAPRTIEHRRTMIVPLVISYALEYSLMHLAPQRVSVALARAAALRNPRAPELNGHGAD